VVENDRAVGPAVVVDQTQVREQAHAHGLQTLLVAHGEAVAVDLPVEEQSLSACLYEHWIDI